MYKFLLHMVCLLFSMTEVIGQVTTYNMSNAYVEDCEGTLLDSEAGTGGLTYGNNENFVFTICSGGRITMTFSTVFKIESFDTLYLYDGADTNSTLLGAYTDSTAPPTTIANSGCLTVHFKSDNNVAYLGWEADWTTDKVPPVPPVMTVNPVPSCSTTTITLALSKKVFCDSIQASQFTVTGPVNNIQVTNISTLGNCGGSSDSTAQIQLLLNKDLDQNCDYIVEYNLGLPDNCDSIWYFLLVDTFRIDDCPFNVDITATGDTICPGMCTDLTATISGNGPNCLTYNYTWNQGLPSTAGPHTVCPTTTTTYTVSVQATTGGPIVNQSKTIYFVNPTILEPDTIEVCQSDSSFTIRRSTGGGRFSGPGIIDRILGLFEPDSAGPGNHYIKYGFPNFCEDSILIIVKPLDAGLDEAACPGTAPFLVSPFSPSGGTWSGDSITSLGIFNPAVSGVYILTYTFNGCSESKVMTVDSISLLSPIDTLCQSDTAFPILISPAGGRWNGIGITDSILGIFDPSVSTGNRTLTYKLSGVGNSGCSFQFDVNVLPVDARNNLLACPNQAPFTLNPAATPSGGSWSGLGITNSLNGTYDAFQAFNGSNGNDTLTYTAPNGCTDERIVYVRNTRVFVDTLTFCETDTALFLDWFSVQRTPGNGSWSGPGSYNISWRWYFSPSNAGVGTHTLFYTANTCVDSVVMVVYPNDIKKQPFNFLFPDTTVCSTHPSWSFGSMPPGGRWTGNGITNSKTGLFEPSQAGAGTHTIKYETSNGCPTDSVNVTVYPFVEAQILNLDTAYCYIDTLIPLILKPNGGVFGGVGVDSNLNFNPAVAGEGTHTFTYAFGNGLCATDTVLEVSISAPIIAELVATDTFLCPGESTTLTATASGGKEGALYKYEWNEGLFPVSEHTVSPNSSTTYQVQVSDECSDPALATVNVQVAGNIDIDVESSEKLCFGLEGYTKVILPDTGDYSIEWQTKPVQSTDSIRGFAGSSYEVIITDNNTGCEMDTISRIPSYKNVVASFSVSPNFECIPSDQKEVTFLDLSYNADSGRWDFAGLGEADYVLGENPSFTFTEAGFYTVTLEVSNIGGCRDTASVTLCVEDIRPVFVADAFTPNGDGVNDVLHVKAQGVKNMRFLIYDRWGTLVFESDNFDQGWDGTIRGMKANPGVYIWVVESKLINNETIVEKGNVTLIR